MCKLLRIAWDSHVGGSPRRGRTPRMDTKDRLIVKRPATPRDSAAWTYGTRANQDFIVARRESRAGNNRAETTKGRPGPSKCTILVQQDQNHGLAERPKDVLPPDGLATPATAGRTIVSAAASTVAAAAVGALP